MAEQLHDHGLETSKGMGRLNISTIGKSASRKRKSDYVLVLPHHKAAIVQISNRDFLLLLWRLFLNIWDGKVGQKWSWNWIFLFESFSLG